MERRGRMTRATPRTVHSSVLLLLAWLPGCGPGGFAEEGTLPDGTDRPSQPASVRQRMGPAEITVLYGRPSARGRELFGGIVPWDSVWNPGANEATRIESTHDLLVEGRRLPAGRYSLWAIPGPEEWELIFSTAWDVYHVPYPEGQDAMRLRIRPREGDPMETLGFYFPVAAADSAELVLHWGRTVLRIGLRLAPEEPGGETADETAEARGASDDEPRALNARSPSGTLVRLRPEEVPLRAGTNRFQVALEGSRPADRPVTVDLVSPTMPTHGIARYAAAPAGEAYSVEVTIPMEGRWLLYVNLDHGDDAAAFDLDVAPAEEESAAGKASHSSAHH